MALDYWRNGYKPVPLLGSGKGTVPAGITGYAVGVTEARVRECIARYPDKPLCLRLEGLVAADVDHYDEKRGGDTIAHLVERYGPLPPTVRVSSRFGQDYDGESGIRLYRLAEAALDLEEQRVWRTELGPGVEVIRRGHRQVVAWPSRHPVRRTVYRWLDELSGDVNFGPLPPVETLPALPDQWLPAFLKEESDTITRAADVPMDWLTGGEPCGSVRAAADPSGWTSRHDGANRSMLRLLRLGEQGHRGVETALDGLRTTFLEAVTNDRTRSSAEADAEWSRGLAGAVALIDAEPSTGGSKGCCRTPAEARTGPTPFVAGGAFILDAPAHVPAVWGRGDEVLWSEGESLILAGPPGVGKTTVAGQLVRARILGSIVLGLPVAPGRRVLYLAMDRPKQIARSMRRTLHDIERAVLDERLVIWQGPPPKDVAKHPEALLRLATQANADTVVVDSLKDAALGLSDDDAGAGYNRARQQVLAANIELLELHHTVKQGHNGSKPTALQHLYGSTWIAAGAGSVLHLWGAAGDPIVEMRHLKQPVMEVGPYQLIHDHEAGRTTIWHAADLVQLARDAGPAGISVSDAAHVLFNDTSRANVEKARRRLEDLVKQGFLAKRSGIRDGGIKEADHYVYVEGDFSITPRITRATEPGTDTNPAARSRSGQEPQPSPITDSVTPITPSLDHGDDPHTGGREGGTAPLAAGAGPTAASPVSATGSTPTLPPSERPPASESS